MKKRNIKRWLIVQADNYQRNLKILICGFLLFTCGGAFILASNFLLQAGVTQELIAAAGLILMGFGLILALIGYVSLSVLRLFRFFTDDHTHD